VTDYFALFGQPRRPWLDPEELERKYYQLARQTHPDVSSREKLRFAEVNQGYRTLRNAKLRLQHLLTLAGKQPAGHTTEIGPDLTDLFAKVSAALATNSAQEIVGVLKRVEESLEQTCTNLRELNNGWNGTPAELDEAERLYRCFSFLDRWKDLLDEARTPRM
jgi:curved DNA-binding protein CbpA